MSAEKGHDVKSSVRTFEPGELRVAVAAALAQSDTPEEWDLDDTDAILARLGIDGDQPVTVVSGRLEQVSREEINRGLLNKLYIVTRVPAPAETGGNDG